MNVFDLAMTKTVDRVPALRQRIEDLIKREILVGVTASTANDGIAEGEMNNAAKAYINDNGAPEVNIPQREFMRPGIQSAEPQIVSALKQAAVASLAGDARGTEAGLDKAGLRARNGVVNEIDSGPLDPGTRTLSPVTIEMRKRGRGPNRPPRNSTEPLVDTGKLRQAITYTVGP